jgi:LPS export ABC transporter protein LptC
LGILSLALLGWLVWVSTVQAGKVKEAEFVAEDQMEKTEVYEPVGYGYKEGAVLWRMSGLKSVEVKETQESTINRIYEMTFFKKGEPNLNASGDAGYWDKSREKLILKGNVVCKSADESTKLTTDEMIWYDKTEVIECPKPLKLFVDDNLITADALYSDKDLVVLEFIGNVKMFIVGLQGESFITKEKVFPLDTVEERKKAKKGITIECEYIYYNKDTKYLRCYPKVPMTAIRKHRLNAEGRPQQYTLEWDPTTGKTTWGETLAPTEKEFLGTSDEAPQQEPSRVEVEDIGQAMGWRQPSDTPPQPVSDTGTTELLQPKPASEGELSSDDYKPGRVFAHQDNKAKKIWCDFMEIFLDEKKIKARGKVHFEAKNLKDEERPPKSKVGKAITSEPTWVDADYMNYFWDEELVDAWGGAHGWQNEKDFVGKSITYSDSRAILLSYGDVVVKQLGGKWLERHDILEDIKDEEAKEDAQKPTTIFANSALSYTESDWSYGWGDVLFRQKEQKIRGGRVEYDDSTETMIMYDDVQFKNEDGEWMIADKLTMDFNTENYTVEGQQSKARVLVPPDYRDDLDEWEKEREGEGEAKPEEGNSGVEVGSSG